MLCSVYVFVLLKHTNTHIPFAQPSRKCNISNLYKIIYSNLSNHWFTLLISLKWVHVCEFNFEVGQKSMHQQICSVQLVCCKGGRDYFDKYNVFIHHEIRSSSNTYTNIKYWANLCQKIAFAKYLKLTHTLFAEKNKQINKLMYSFSKQDVSVSSNQTWNVDNSHQNITIPKIDGIFPFQMDIRTWHQFVYFTNWKKWANISCEYFKIYCVRWKTAMQCKSMCSWFYTKLFGEFSFNGQYHVSPNKKLSSRYSLMLDTRVLEKCLLIIFELVSSSV